MCRGKRREGKEKRIYQLFLRGKIEHIKFLEMISKQLVSVGLYLVFNSVLFNLYLKISHLMLYAFQRTFISHLVFRKPNELRNIIYLHNFINR